MKVSLLIAETMHYKAEVEMSEADYEKWCDRIDHARGFDKETAAEELMDLAQINRLRDGYPYEIEIEDFEEV